MFRLYLVCALLAAVNLFPFVMNAIVERYQAELWDGVEEEVEENEETYLSCMCENGTDVTEPLDEEIAIVIIKGELKPSTCKTFHAQDVCGLLLLCSGCVIRHLSCFKTEDMETMQCLNEVHLLNDNYFGLRDRKSKDMITIEHARVKRQAHICTYPSNLKTADVACQTAGNKVSCTEACIFGHTMKEGVLKTMSCNKKDNAWVPSGFTECDPFVDCSLTLKTPGSVDCYSGTTRTAPLCYVSCNHYEDQPAIPRRAYECTISGSWNRDLPFCATAGSGLLLVPRPKNLAVNPGYSK